MKIIPSKGQSYEKVLSEMESFRKEDANYIDGRTWSLVYHLNEDHTEFLKKAHNLYFSENALNPMAFKSLKRFEHEIVQMTGSLLNAGEDAAGTLTSGGTESCLLPVMAYRERALSKKRFKRPFSFKVAATLTTSNCQLLFLSFLYLQLSLSSHIR